MIDHTDCYGPRGGGFNHAMFCPLCGYITHAGDTIGMRGVYACIKCADTHRFKDGSGPVPDSDLPQMVCMDHTGMAVEKLKRLTQGQLLLLVP